MKKEYWFPTAFSHWGEEELAAIARVVSSGRFTMGDETAAFEEELAAFNHRRHAVAVNSGSSANLIATVALSQRDNSPTMARVPALAWATTYAPFVHEGIGFKLMDCDDTWCVPASEFSVPDDSFIVTCSILGNPAPLVEIDAFATEYDDDWLNDDCESFGATASSGLPTAAYGTIATQSFFYSHQLSAIEGGACLTDDAELARMLRVLRDHGMDRSVRTHTASFDKEYNFENFGFNVRPVEMHMAIAREQLKKVNQHRVARRQNWNYFAEACKSLPVKLPTFDLLHSNPFGLHFELNEPRRRTQLAYALRAEGVDCRLPTGGSFHLHPYGRMWRNQHTPRADAIHARGMFLGNAPYGIVDKIDKAVEVIKYVLEA